MKVNFDIIDNHALNFEGRYIDLHNNFDFVGFDYNVVNREINLNWKKSIGYRVEKNVLSGLVLTHKAVTFLEVTGQDENSHCDDGCCLGEITFFPSAERELKGCLITQSKPNDGDDIIYFFENGQQIRIHCDQIELNANID